MLARMLPVCTVLILSSAAPAHAQPYWFRGNTHVHTAGSDGDSPPDVVARWYLEHGYDFVAITDHDRLTPVEALNRELGASGEFLVLSGVEVTDRIDRRPVHLNGLSVSAVVLPQGGSTVSDVIDRDARAIRQAGGMPQLNHPNGLLRAALTPDEVANSSELTLFEVCCADWRGGGGVLSTEELWDEVLSRGRVLHAVAADDAHRFAGASREPGTAWIMVRARELSAAAILTALRAGDFYATTGVSISDYRTGPDAIRVELADAETYGYRTWFIGEGGRVLARDDSAAPAYTFRGDERYVRARIERSDGAFAWTQPVFRATAR